MLQNFLDVLVDRKLLLIIDEDTSTLVVNSENTRIWSDEDLFSPAPMTVDELHFVSQGHSTMCGVSKGRRPFV
jgi:hypothetical protein